MDMNNTINRREFARCAAACALLGVRSRTAQSAAKQSAAERGSLPLQRRGGVSLAGAEFAAERDEFSNKNPGSYGRDYQYPQRQTIEYFAAQGLALLRIPFRWERIQPQLLAPLDAAELARLRAVVRYAGSCGAAIVLDVHNYGRYRLALPSGPRTVIIDEMIAGTAPVPRAAFADLWRRLAAEFASDRTVVGLGLMNEPHDMGRSDWKQISQAAVDAIRQANNAACVVVAGDGWSNAHRFAEVNGPRAWINDPARRVVYEAHCYFDADASGKYHRSYASELRDEPRLAERGVKRFSAFAEWCQRNNVPGFLGEFGIPGDDPGWRAVMSTTLAAVQQSEMSACYWAAGEWWNDYPLSIQPRNEMRDPAPQQEVLRKFLGDSARVEKDLSHAPTPFKAR